MCGAVLSAVSPAAVVPRMVRIYEEGYGRKHSAPQLVLAGASLLDLLNVPLSIMTGIFFGILCGTVLYLFFESRFKKGQYVRNSEKAVIILALGLFLSAIEDRLPFAFSGLLAVMAMACVIRVRGESSVWGRLSQKFGKLWIASEVLLFTLLGAAVDVRNMAVLGVSAAVMIAGALVFRSLGVWLSPLQKPLLTKKNGFSAFCPICPRPRCSPP